MNLIQQIEAEEIAKAAGKTFRFPSPAIPCALASGDRRRHAASRPTKGCASRANKGIRQQFHRSQDELGEGVERVFRLNIADHRDHRGPQGRGASAKFHYLRGRTGKRA